MNLKLLEEIKPTLKDKWLDYYEANQRIAKKFMDIGYTSTNGVYRPNSELILSIITYLEPRLEEYLFCFFLVSNNLDKIVEVLGLNFDPELELKKRREQNSQPQQAAIITSPQQE